MYPDFTDVQVGDEVKVSRGRSRDRISTVYKVTAQTFCVEGFGRFWKKNGKGHGDSDSWYGRYAEKIEPGDRERIAREATRINNSNLYSEHRVRDFNDDELARVADIIRECNKRRETNLEVVAHIEGDS
jgi:ribosomal protein L24